MSLPSTPVRPRVDVTAYDIDRTKNGDGVSPSDHFPVLVDVGPR